MLHLVNTTSFIEKCYQNVRRLKIVQTCFSRLLQKKISCIGVFSFNAVLLYILYKINSNLCVLLFFLVYSVVYTSEVFHLQILHGSIDLSLLTNE